MKYSLTFTHAKTLDNKQTTEAITRDEANKEILYATILQTASPNIPITWEDWDPAAWNPFYFTGIMTAEAAYANAVLLNLSLEQYTNMLIAYHKHAALNATATIEFDVISE